MAFIEAWANGASCFLNTDEIQRISFSKDGVSRQSERKVKVLFKDGAKGEYVMHRNTEKLIRSTVDLLKAAQPLQSVEEVEE